MNQDSFESDKRMPSTGSGKEEGSVNVDERGIPILEEVIDLDLDLSEDSALVPGLDGEPHGLNLPDKEMLLEALKEQLLDQMEEELGEITHQIAEAVALQLSRNMEQTIREELHSSLRSHLETMLDRTLKSNGLPGDD